MHVAFLERNFGVDIDFKLIPKIVKVVQRHMHEPHKSHGKVRSEVTSHVVPNLLSNGTRMLLINSGED